jgi:hypothetical protein
LENDDIAFGFVIRAGDENLPSRPALLSLLRDAYFHNRQVVVSYHITEGKKNGHLRRVEVNQTFVDKRGLDVPMMAKFSLFTSF